MGKNTFYKGFPGKFVKIKKPGLWRWRVPGWYYTLPKFRINLFIGMEIVRGDQNLTHTHTHTHTRARTEAYFIRQE